MAAETMRLSSHSGHGVLLALNHVLCPAAHLIGASPADPCPAVPPSGVTPASPPVD